MESPPFDILANLKNIAYHRVQGEVGKDPTISHLVEMSKHFLCEKTGTLWEDPIWGRYSDEGLIVEYFSYRMSDPDDNFEDEFLKSIGGLSPELDDFSKWADEQMDADKVDLEEGLEDEISLGHGELEL